MLCSRASADSRSMPYFHQSSPPRKAHHDHLGVAGDALDPARSTDIGWRRSRKWASRTLGSIAAKPPGLPRGGERAEIAVSERQHDDIARRLAKIDRFD